MAAFLGMTDLIWDGAFNADGIPRVIVSGGGDSVGWTYTFPPPSPAHPFPGVVNIRWTDASDVPIPGSGAIAWSLQGSVLYAPPPPPPLRAGARVAALSAATVLPPIGSVGFGSTASTTL